MPSASSRVRDNAQQIPRLRTFHNGVRGCTLEQNSRGEVLSASPGAARVFGLSPVHLRGAMLTDLVQPADHAAILGALSRAAAGEAVLVPAQLRPGAGSARASFEVARTTGGLRTRVVPLTERPANDPEPDARLPMSSERLADVSHEIRTPLNAVIGFADALRQESFGPLGDARYRDYAKLIQESGQHVLALVNDLLELSRAEGNRLRIERLPVKAGEVVAACADMVRLEAEKAGLKLTCEIDPRLGTVSVDPKILRQVVLNLLSNALKFTESGSVTIACRREGGELRVIVRDTGVGMSRRDLQRVGERFYQARQEGVRGIRGNGIGLALSHALAKAHGGRLAIASELGVGTSATLSLPLEIPRETTQGARLRAAQPPRRRPVTLEDLTCRRAS